MFIELTEYLRCPSGHGDQCLVLAPDRMDGRRVIEGTLGCPVCHREFSVVGGVADFGRIETSDLRDRPDPDVIHALMDVTGSGGYIVLVGSVAALGVELTRRVEDVHLVGVNAPPDVEPHSRISLATAADSVPLRSEIARAVVVGAEITGEWLRDAARVVLRGRRLVIVGERTIVPGSVRCLATGDGMTVGERR